MQKKRLSDFMGDTRFLGRIGGGDPWISELAYDSREVRPGTLYFALKGIHSDGHNYIAGAIQAGASAIIHSDPVENPAAGVVYLRVENGRTLMSPVAAAFHDHPSREMKIIGVTGTDGKSTTISYLHQLLTMAGYKAGFLSTVHFNLGGETLKNYLRQSTPEPLEIHRLLRKMRRNGCTHAVVESTSHGLSPLNNRLGDVAFDVGVLTNITHEHLEFHKTLERYVDDKANLFRMLPPGGGAVINGDDPRGDLFARAAPCPAAAYSMENRKAPLWAGKVEAEGSSQRFTLGGEGVSRFLPLVPELKAAKGRMVSIQMGQPYTVLVDYAHTPGSFEKLFPFLREQTRGKLIALFGSAGERDREKRPIQGKIASRYCDILVITDEDPRQEDPQAIIDGITAGCGGFEEGINLYAIQDRPSAIRHAFSLARGGDMVALLGKGHEDSIIYADGPRGWDEEAEARRALVSLGYAAAAP